MTTTTSTPMTAVRLHGPRDLRVDQVSHPGPGQALLRVTAVGVCGSDLHTYIDGPIIPSNGPLTWCAWGDAWRWSASPAMIG